MFGIGKRALSATSPRVLLTSFLLLGMVSGQGGRGTMAYFTSTAQSSASNFASGTVDVSTSSTLPTSTSFGWNLSNTGTTNCATVLVPQGSQDTTGTASAASYSTLTSNLTTTAGEYLNHTIEMTSGAASGQRRRISSYTAGANTVFTVDRDWNAGALPATGNTFKITKGEVVYSGTANGTNTTTTVQTTSAGWTANQWTGFTVTVTSGTYLGSTSTISSNTADTLTLATALGGALLTTDTYTIGWSLASQQAAGQGMTPGQLCVGKVSVKNTVSGSADAWMRFRLVRATASGTPANSLNDKLRFYMFEYTGDTTIGAGGKQNNENARDLDCTPAHFFPANAATASGVGVGSDVAASTNVGTRLANATYNSVVRAPVSYLGTSGNVIGTGGLALSQGLASTPPTESGMSTTSANSVNLIGSDEVISVSTGANSHGTDAEASLASNSQKHYCAAVFYPSDTDATATNGTGDNLAAGASLQYYLVVTAAQKAGR